jgi:tyrosyl-tRNA synthetase
VTQVNKGAKTLDLNNYKGHSDMSVFDILEGRGFVQQYTSGVMDLLRGSGVSFYVGFDPTADSLHAGSLVPIMAMAHLQRAGHRPIALVGGGTGMVGDPSGKEEARQLLTSERIEHNKQAIKGQIGRFVSFEEGRGELVDNADWLLPLNYIEFLREIGRHFSVNTMLTKASVKARLERGLSFLEFNYQILQAYDFLELYRRNGCRLQMGGDDQWGNMVAGTDLIRRVEGAEAHALTFPLLTTATGAKMGKTANGAVWLDADRLPVYDYYQYWINVDDRDVVRFLKLFTFLPLERIAELGALKGAEIREAKRVLAFEATSVCHGKAAAERAEAGAKAAFSGGDAASAMPKYETSLPVGLLSLLADSGLCQSRSDARRQVRGGAIKVAGEKISAEDFEVTSDHLDDDGAVVVSRGKKKRVRVTMGASA